MPLHSHILLMALFAFFVALVSGVLLRDGVREQLRTGSAIFGGLVGAGVLLGWLLFFLPL